MQRGVVRSAVAGLVMTAAAGASALTIEERPLPDLDHMIGAMVMIGFDGTRPGDAGVAHAARMVQEGRIGGIVLMDRNIRSPAQVRALTAAFRAGAGVPPPLIAIDQEGGNVQRLSGVKGFAAYPSARAVARGGDAAAAYRVYKAMAEELAAAGFNLNFGPVVDLNRNARNHVINRRGRSFSGDAGTVTAYARAFIAAHREAGILTSLKHFPGHGSSRDDTHDRLADISASWDEAELAPYRTLAAEEAVDTVMVGHLYHRAFAGDGLPATLQREAIEGWLRMRIGFSGVVITDDMGMGAIKRHHSHEESVVKAVIAGNDILLFANPGTDPDFARRTVALIRAAVEDGRISYRRVIQSYDRITGLRQRLAGSRQAADACRSTAGMASR